MTDKNESNAINIDDPRLTAFVLGELSKQETSEIETAISGSPELAAAIAEIRQMVGLLGSAYGTEEPVRLLDEQRATLTVAGASESDESEIEVSGMGASANGRVGATKNKVAEKKTGSTRRPWLPIAIAASLLGLMLGGAWYVNEFGAPPMASNVSDAVKSQALESAGAPAAKAKANAMKREQERSIDDRTDSILSDSLPAMDADKAVADKVEEFNRLVDEQRFSEAQVVAAEAKAIAPNNETAVLMNEKSKVISRVLSIGEVRDSKEESFWDGMFEARQASIPGSVGDAPAASLGANLRESEPSADSQFGGSAIIGRAPMQPSVELVTPSKEEEGAVQDFMRDSSSQSQKLVLSEENRLRIARSRSSMQPTDSPAATPEAEVESFDLEEEVEVLPESAFDAGGGFPGNGRGGVGGGLGGMGGGPGGGRPGGKLESASESTEADDLVVMPNADEWQRKKLLRRKFAAIQPPTEVAPARGMQQGPSGGEGQSGESSEDSPQFDDKSKQQEQDVQKQAQQAGESDGRGGAPLAVARGENQSLITKSEGMELEKKASDLSELEALGIRAETRMVQQTKTRTVPVQQTRKEVKTRNVVIDGKNVLQRYEVEVPYTENVTQNYSVQVPQTILSYKNGTPRELVERLAKRVDPSGTKTLDLKQLFNFTEESGDKVDAAKDLGGDDDVELKLAAKLNESLQESEGKDVIAGKVIEELKRSLQHRNAEVRKNRGWKRVKAIPNTTRLMVGDKDELDMNGMQVNVQVDGFRARVLIDCFYYNDRAQQLEGNFKLRLPDDASLYYFAFGESVHRFGPKGVIAQEEFLDDGTQFVSLGASNIKKARENMWANVKESRMVPKEKAAHAYHETVRRKVDPALVEWSGAGVFNARVFPLAPNKLHRIVIGYDVNLKRENGDLVYELGLPEQAGQCQVDINVQPVEGVEYEMMPKSDPFQESIAGQTFRRYRFVGPQPNGIRLKATPADATNAKPTLLHSNGEEEGKFWGVQVTPELPVEQVEGSPQAVFMLDTSLSSNPDKFNVWLKMLETTLNSNRDSLKQFNVMFFNVDAHLWQDKWVDNTPENVESVLAKCDTLSLEGATDLYGAIEHLRSQKWFNNKTGADLFLLSDGAANWGETNLRLIGRQLEQSNMGSLFAYQSGLTGTAIANLRFLAGETGGAVFSVATEAEVKTAARAHRKRPWKLDSLAADGASDLMTAGRVKWVYPGQTITVVGRGEVTGEVELTLTQAASVKVVRVSPEKVESDLASRLYGQVAVGQLESLGETVFDVSAAYARHFRITGDTCSLLMLESEADYLRFDIKPEEDLFVIKTKAAKDLVAGTLKKSSDELADPKAQLESWLARLENMPGMQFKMPTALRLAMEGIEIEAISKPLDCKLTTTEGLSKEYLDHLNKESLDYDLIATEANRRGGSSVDEAIKVFSSLVERNPGNLEISRDVAFTAMEMGRPAQAFHLLRNVARARPFEGSIYPALGQCLSQLGQADQAIVYYEIALGGTFSRCGANFKEIVSAEYAYLLRRIASGELESSIAQFAKARLETLNKEMRFKESNLVITMLWNTDQTDVDLHVTEPSGEECSYENKKTRSGGQITTDITTGFGPEMYSNTKAPSGKYEIKVKYFSNRQNRTELQNKVHLLIYRGFGTDKEQLTRRTVQLKKVGEKESVATIGVD